jgi:hypothetical protein
LSSDPTSFDRRLPPLVHMVRGPPQPRRIVLVVSDSQVASIAQQTAQLAGAVVMIEAWRSRKLPLADQAPAVLASEHPLVILDRDSVFLDVALTPVRPAVSQLHLAKLAVRRVTVPLLRVQLIAMKREVSVSIRGFLFRYSGSSAYRCLARALAFSSWAAVFFLAICSPVHRPARRGAGQSRPIALVTINERAQPG